MMRTFLRWCERWSKPDVCDVRDGGPRVEALRYTFIMRTAQEVNHFAPCLHHRRAEERRRCGAQVAASIRQRCASLRHTLGDLSAREAHEAIAGVNCTQFLLAAPSAPSPRGPSKVPSHPRAPSTSQQQRASSHPHHHAHHGPRAHAPSAAPASAPKNTPAPAPKPSASLPSLRRSPSPSSSRHHAARRGPAPSPPPRRIAPSTDLRKAPLISDAEIRSKDAAPLWAEETARLHRATSARFGRAGEGPTVAVCVAATADVTSPARWASFVRAMGAFAQLVVVATSSADVTSIVGASSSSMVGSGGSTSSGGGSTSSSSSSSLGTAVVGGGPRHVLAAGQQWEGPIKAAAAPGGSRLIVRRSARRMLAWHRESNLTTSRAWALHPVLATPSAIGSGLTASPRIAPITPSTPKPAAGKPTRYEEPHFAPWAEAELALQRDCLDVIETVEAGGDAAVATPGSTPGSAPGSARGSARGFPSAVPVTGEAGTRRLFTLLALMRADHAWMPHAPPITLARPAIAYLTAGHRPPTVIIPDTDDALGYNDRMAFLSRAAGPAYFRRSAHLLDGRYTRKVRTTEELLKIAILRERGAVHVRRLPTLTTLSCCAEGRASCWNKLCLPLCAGAPRSRLLDVLFGRSPREAATALQNAVALRSGAASIGLPSRKLNCTPPRPWMKHFKIHMTPPFAYAFCVSPFVPMPSERSESARRLKCPCDAQSILRTSRDASVGQCLAATRSS